MKEHGGFVDLRLNRQEDRGNESFWPSFTDIMTVIVMIFLISMVVVLLRNMELVKELRATLEAEREAMELARAAGEEKQSLSGQLQEALEQLQAAERRIDDLETRVERLQEQNEVRARALAHRDRQIEALREERDSLVRQRRQLLADKEAAEESARAAEEQRKLSAGQLAGLQQAYRQLEEELQRRQLQSAALRSKLELQSQQLAQARRERQEVEEKYLVLAGDYDSLKVKYDKLVKPARSASGRHLVEVRYFKRGGKYHIEWREGDSGPFRPVSRQQLHSRLAQLKKAHREGLYIRVILPEESGLSYSEAWKFTNDLHRRYDYYYQQDTAAREPPPVAPAGGE